MTFFQRVATVAAISLSLTGLAGIGTAGQAANVHRASLAVPMVTTPELNSLPSAAVPVASPITADLSDQATASTATVATPDKFTSLADAVAAQDQDVSDDTLRCLATAIYFEAKSEPMNGQLAVAQVIVNRTKSGRFPTDVCGVVKQRGQFSFVHGGALPTISTTLGQYRTALKIAKVALAKTWNGPAPTALFFHARQIAPGLGRAVVALIGNHVFYR